MRIQTGIFAYLNYKSENDGYTCVYKDENEYKSKKNFYELFNQYLRKNGAIKGTLLKEEIDEAIDNLIKDKKIVKEINIKNNKTYLYTAELNFIENSIAKYLNIINKRPFKFCEKKDVDEYFLNYKGFKLDPKQKDAVSNALTSNISILTGGPGTGKTATVNVIVQAFEEICMKKYKKKADIVLLGPTGKAADRIQELTNKSASTIHRKLCLRPDSKFVDIELDCTVVIIDESSMIDIYLMEKLLSSIKNNTIIVFVGDINQLPSVGPGKVLDDMIESNAISTVTLTKIFRQKQNSTIVENAHHIINAEDTKHGFKLNEGNFHFINVNNSIETKDYAENLLKDLIKSGKLMKDIMILSPMKDKDGGTTELNELIQNTFNKNKISETFLNKTFKVEDRVIQTKNNYDLKVYNGFIGTITSIYEENNKRFLTVDFDNQTSIIEYNETEVNELDLAYATTVHKAQGSEYPIVILIMNKSQFNMLTSKLLYTAITRAKQEIYCIGDIESLNKAINEKNKNKHEYRISQLAEKIKE